MRKAVDEKTIAIEKCENEKSELGGKLEIERESRKAMQKSNMDLADDLAKQKLGKRNDDACNSNLTKTHSKLWQDYCMLASQSALLTTENVVLNNKYTQSQLQNKVLLASLQSSRATLETWKRENERLRKEIQTSKSNVKPELTENGSTGTEVKNIMGSPLGGP